MNKYLIFIITLCAYNTTQAMMARILLAPMNAALNRPLPKKTTVHSPQRGALRSNYFSNRSETPQYRAFAVRQQYLDQLKKMEAHMWQQLKEYNITPAKVRLLLKKEHEAIQRNSHEFFDAITVNGVISSETQLLVQAILNDFNIRKDALSIVPFKYEDGMVGSIGNTLLIDEELLKQQSAQVQEFAIAQQIQHILNNDLMQSIAVEMLFEAMLNRLPAKAAAIVRASGDDSPTTHLIHFQEKRADVCAAIKSKKYASSAVECLEQSLKETDNEAPNGLKAVVSSEIRHSNPGFAKATPGSPAIHPRDKSLGILATSNKAESEGSTKRSLSERLALAKQILYHLEHGIS